MGILDAPTPPAAGLYADTAYPGTYLITRTNTNKGDLVTNAGNYGALDPTGVADCSAILQAAINETSDGGTLLIPPGTYRVNTTISTVGKSLIINAPGVTLVNYTSNGPAIDIRGGMETTYTVSAVTPGTVTIDGNAVPTLDLAVPASTGYVAGDVIKLVADDAIPGGRAAVGGSVARVGQFLSVNSSTSTTVTVLSSGLMDPFTTNIRVARIKQKTCVVNGLTVTVDPSSASGFGVRIFEMVNPTLNGVTVQQSMGAGFTMVGCYGYTLNSPTVGYGNNTGQFGYGITDTSCAFGRVNGLVARNVRHAYTDGTNQIAAGSNSLHQFGRTHGTVVVNSVAHSTTGTGFDTHQYSRGVRFENCQTYNAGTAGFALRGQQHTINNCRAVNPATGLMIFSEDPTDGDSWGHTVDNLTIESPSTLSIDWYVNKASNTLDTRPTRFGRVTVINAPANSINFRNATGRINTLEVSTKDFTTNSARLFTLTNSNISIETLRTDFSGQATSVTGCQPVYMAAGAGVLRVNDWRNTFGGATNANRFNYLVDTSNATPGTTTNRVQAERIVTDYMVATSAIPWADSEGDTYVNFKSLKSTGNNSSSQLVYFSPTTVTSPSWQLNKTTDTNIVLSGLIGSAMNMFTLRNGRFVGQTATIINASGGATLTVQNGSTYNTQTKTGADVALTTNASMVIAWDGTIWRQLS